MIYPNIYKHDCLKVHLNTFACVGRGFHEKTDDIIEGNLIVTSIFVDDHKIKEFINSKIMNDSISVYQIDILDALL